MKKNITITVANPAGNKTIFVHDSFERESYAAVAEQLLAMKDIAAEQVAFILLAPECGRAEGRMEMCGLEFCGNATRAFGLMVARELGIAGEGHVFLDVSGTNEILTVDVNTDTGYARVKMPACVGIEELNLSDAGLGSHRTEFAEDDGSLGGLACEPESSAASGGLAGALGRTASVESSSSGSADLSHVQAVNFGGILHLILPDIEASAENFERVKSFVYANQNPPAMGAMFYDTQKKFLTPVVYVKDVDSTYFEGSCASGSAACAVAFGLAAAAGAGEDGTHSFTLPQPGGTVGATVEIKNGRPANVYIDGPVEIDPPIEVEVEI